MLAVVASGVLVGAVGCGGGLSATAGPEPSAIVSRSSDAGAQGPSWSAATTSASRTASSAAPSPSLDPNSDAAILAAVHQYVAAQQIAARTGDAREFFARTTATCNCRAGVIAVARFLVAHGYHQDLTYRFVEPPAIVATDGSHSDVRIAFASGAYHVINSHERVIRTVSNDSGRFIISFELRGNHWIAFASTNA